MEQSELVDIFDLPLFAAPPPLGVLGSVVLVGILVWWIQRRVTRRPAPPVFGSPRDELRRLCRQPASSVAPEVLSRLMRRHLEEELGIPATALSQKELAAGVDPTSRSFLISQALVKLDTARFLTPTDLHPVVLEVVELLKGEISDD